MMDYAKQALFEAGREKVDTGYRLVMLRMRDHETAGRFKEANECAAIRFDMEKIAAEIGCKSESPSAITAPTLAGQRRVTQKVLIEIAKTAALAAGKNARVAPQLLLGDILLTLYDAFPAALWNEETS